MASPSVNTTYTLVVTDANGCTATAIATVTMSGQVLVCEYKKGVYTTTCVPANKVTNIVANRGYQGACLTSSKMDASEVSVSANIQSENVTEFAAYPNPFVEQTKLIFTLDNEATETSLSIYDMQGRLISNVFKGIAEAGKAYEFNVKANDLSDGIYFATLQSGTLVKHIKLVITK